MDEEKITKKRIFVDNQIDAFISSISVLWYEEPLDGDETKDIADRVLRKLDEINGNTD